MTARADGIQSNGKRRGKPLVRARRPETREVSRHDLDPGGRENNLQAVDVDVPKHKITAVTGVSGSGKSSLAFDATTAESQRLLNETLTALSNGMCPTCQGTGSVNNIDLDAPLDRRTATSSLPCRSLPRRVGPPSKTSGTSSTRELSRPRFTAFSTTCRFSGSRSWGRSNGPDTSLLVCSPSRAGRRSRPPGPARRPPPRTRCPAAPPSGTPCAGARTRTRYRCGH